jgi:hypothetical protein
MFYPFPLTWKPFFHTFSSENLPIDLLQLFLISALPFRIYTRLHIFFLIKLYSFECQFMNTGTSKWLFYTYSKRLTIIQIIYFHCKPNIWINGDDDSKKTGFSWKRAFGQTKLIQFLSAWSLIVWKWISNTKYVSLWFLSDSFTHSHFNYWSSFINSRKTKQFQRALSVVKAKGGNQSFIKET